MTKKLSEHLPKEMTCNLALKERRRFGKENPKNINWDRMRVGKVATEFNDKIHKTFKGAHDWRTQRKI